MRADEAMDAMARGAPLSPLLMEDDALFLDLDGTLLDIAATPDAVVIPRDLRATLASLTGVLGGALAIISGRPLSQLDALLGATRLPAAAEHGAVIRLPNGSLEEHALSLPGQDAWLAGLRAATSRWPGVFIEVKPHSLVVHFRQAPTYADAVRALVDRLAARDPEAIEVLPAKMAWEIKRCGVDKGAALRRLMRDPVFAGRRPVFIGDDTTDERAIAEAMLLGGMGLHVARDFGGKAGSVRAWLRESLSGLQPE